MSVALLSRSPTLRSGLAQQIAAAAGGVANVPAEFLYGVNTTVSGGALTTWADALGRSPSIGSVGASRPTDNGSAYVYDGVDDYSDGLFTVGAQPLTVFLAVKVISVTGGTMRIFDGGAATEALYYTVADPNTYIFINDTLGPNTDMVLGTTAVVTLVLNGASSSIQFNDATALVGDTGAGKTVTGVSLAASSQPANVAYKAAIITTGLRTAGEKAAVKSILYSAYGVTP